MTRISVNANAIRGRPPAVTSISERKNGGRLGKNMSTELWSIMDTLSLWTTEDSADWEYTAPVDRMQSRPRVYAELAVVSGMPMASTDTAKELTAGNSPLNTLLIN